jgi:hypothetical protein
LRSWPNTPSGGREIVVLSAISGAAKIPNSNELAVNVDATLTYAAKRILDAKLPRLAKTDGYDARRC